LNENGEFGETKTSRQLLDEVFYSVPMYQRIEQNNNAYIKNLFVQDRSIDRQPSVLIATDTNESQTETAVPSEDNKDQTQEYYSTIFSINANGFGFLKDEINNNLFFHSSSVTNRDFSELQPGMKVKYTQEEDEERSKRDNALRYRACKVTVVE
jgi:cold shock CspA family protein